MSLRDKAHELLGHYLTQGGAFGDREEAEAAIDALLAAAVEMVAARDTLRGVMQNARCTLRDLFAAQALQGMHAACAGDIHPTAADMALLAKTAYEQADAMLAVRSLTPDAGGGL